MSIKIEVDGLDAIRAQFTNLEVRFDAAIADALSFTIHEARNRIVRAIQSGPATGRTYQLYNPKRTHRASAPGEAPMTDTGMLVRSIQVDTSPGMAMVGSRLAYAAYLEYGTRKMAPRPVWMPVAEQIPAILRANIEQEISEIL